jgi:hypothetical protein
MKSVTDNRLTQLIVSIMKLSRRRLESSSSVDICEALASFFMSASIAATGTGPKQRHRRIHRKDGYEKQNAGSNQERY